jgi:hypothetical protein
VSSYARMCATYLLASLLKFGKGDSHIRSDNKEAFVVMADLLWASRDPHLNVSSYSTPSQFNADKIWRTASEAICVDSLWKQEEKLKK